MFKFSSHVVRRTQIRTISTSRASFFFENVFGTRKNEEIVAKQDELAKIEPDAKIEILNEQNSPDYVPFIPASNMPNFKIEQWKSKIVSPKDIEATYSKSDIITIINDTFKQVQNKDINQEQYKEINLHDLSFRFQFFKQLQSNLGFDINDFIITQSHDLKQVEDNLTQIINKRWTYERNPNAIVLREEDFKSQNIYLNQELDDYHQQIKFDELVKKANESQEVQA
ncbi:ribosomal subunit 39S-domain-containing protein [Scheffersomyces amazonensis]|uniref:ribosomal subunit 39S-domain-containing protein n=1 Tax=Scheffersomyces amazonensis TaxID=1078765 RepID=UPI00315D5BF8